MTQLNRRSEDTTTGKIIKYWQIIIALTALVGWGYVTNWRVNKHEEIDDARCKIFETKTSQHDVEIAVLQEGIANINKNLEKVIEALEKMRK